MQVNIENGTDVKKVVIQKPEPTLNESAFHFDELFFSVTDHDSTITFANETFLRISKYNEEEMLGRLHKIVRHPDMPRCVFQIFWKYLKSGKPIAAYVKNMSKNGDYYWVLALVYPFSEGYISIRIKPGSELFDQVISLYGEISAYEKELESELDKKSAMDGAGVYLHQKLQELGYLDYNDFMWIALQKEMKNREMHLNSTKSKNKRSKSVSRKLLDLESILKELVLTTDSLISIHDSLATQSEYILNLSRSILLLSMNAQVGSANLDQQDQSLSVVAENMGEQSIKGEQSLIALKDNINHFNNLIGALNFDIISAKLQVEMNIYFKNEIDKLNETDTERVQGSQNAAQLLKQAFVPSLDGICEGILKVNSYLKQITTGVDEIERFLMVLRFIHITGKVEVARMNDKATSFSNTFQELIGEIKDAEYRLNELKNLVHNHQGILISNNRHCKSLKDLKQYF